MQLMHHGQLLCITLFERHLEIWRLINPLQIWFQCNEDFLDYECYLLDRENASISTFDSTGMCSRVSWITLLTTNACTLFKCMWSANILIAKKKKKEESWSRDNFPCYSKSSLYQSKIRKKDLLQYLQSIRRVQGRSKMFPNRSLCLKVDNEEVIKAISPFGTGYIWCETTFPKW